MVVAVQSFAPAQLSEPGPGKRVVDLPQPEARDRATGRDRTSGLRIADSRSAQDWKNQATESYWSSHLP